MFKQSMSLKEVYSDPSKYWLINDHKPRNSDENAVVDVILGYTGIQEIIHDLISDRVVRIHQVDYNDGFITRKLSYRLDLVPCFIEVSVVNDRLDYHHNDDPFLSIHVKQGLDDFTYSVKDNQGNVIVFDKDGSGVIYNSDIDFLLTDRSQILEDFNSLVFFLININLIPESISKQILKDKDFYSDTD